MSRIEEIISNALAGIEETEVAILARELLKTREALALAQQAKGDAEGRAALADRRALGMRPHVFAAMVNAVRDLALQYGQMEQFRCRVADLLSQYIHVQHNSKRVPPRDKIVRTSTPPPYSIAAISTDRKEFERALMKDFIASGAFLAAPLSHGYATARMGLFRPLPFPTDREVRDGMVQVDPREWNTVQAVVCAADNLLKLDPSDATATLINEHRYDLFAALNRLQLLRANQGGAEHA